MLRQRVFGLALGYEDVNDHAALRHDLALQTAAERDCALASPSTLSRFENAPAGTGRGTSTRFWWRTSSRRIQRPPRN